jgi:hypothetical protein
MELVYILLEYLNGQISPLSARFHPSIAILVTLIKGEYLFFDWGILISEFCTKCLQQWAKPPVIKNWEVNSA